MKVSALWQGREVDDGDQFHFNADFSERLYRIKINAIQMKETVDENKKTNDQVLQDRQYQVQTPSCSPCCTYLSAIRSSSRGQHVQTGLPFLLAPFEKDDRDRSVCAVYLQGICQLMRLNSMALRRMSLSNREVDQLWMLWVYVDDLNNISSTYLQVAPSVGRSQ